MSAAATRSCSACARALPVELFLSGEARWLDIAVEGVAPQPRRLLVSVPYALKAADAETIGGKPLSAFVLAGDKSGVGADGLTYVDRRVLASGLAPAPDAAAAGGAGTPATSACSPTRRRSATR